MTDSPHNFELAPRRTRLVVFGAMVIVAVVSIWLIDRRAMIRMSEFELPATPQVDD